MRNLFWTRRVAGVALLGSLMLALTAGLLPVRGADDKTSAKRQEVQAKLDKGRSLAGKNFAAALGLDLENLRTLGSRIDQARRNTEPVCLALLAKELAVAEEVAKKKTEPTAAALMQQAVAMAKARNVPAELRAVAQLADKDKDELIAQADKTDKQIEARKGSAGKGITGYLIVVNRTPNDLRIVVNFRYRGVAEAYSVSRCYVGDSPSSTTYLYAENSRGQSASRTVSYPAGDIEWTIE
jgi:hypothetical protein